MKVKLRPVEDVNRLRAIRTRVLLSSPQGQYYAAAFERHRPELSRLVVSHDELLRLEDTIVSRAFKDFPERTPETGQISKELAKDLDAAMKLLVKVGSPELVRTLKQLRPDLDGLVGRPLRETLEASTKQSRKN